MLEAQACYHQPEQIMPEVEEVPTNNLQLGQCPSASGMLKFSINNSTNRFSSRCDNTLVKIIT